MLRASITFTVVLSFMILMLPAHGSQPLYAQQPPAGGGRGGPSILRESQDRPEQGRGATGSGQAGSLQFDVPFVSLLRIDLPTYEQDKCPLCAQGLPVVKPGSRPVAV
jgi:hypothetical protein